MNTCLYTNDMKENKQTKPLKIIGLPVDRSGCGWYRVRQPLRMIKQYSESEAHVIDAKDDDPIAIAEALSEADIVVLRQGAEAGIPHLKSVVENYGKEIGQPKAITAKWVMDIDDNIEEINPYSEHYRDYGLKEFTHGNLAVWEDGQNGFDLARNRMKVMRLMKAMGEMDAISVTTDKLASYAKRFNDNVLVLPNYVDLSKWWKLETVPHDKLRVAMQGGISHYADWYTVKEPLNALLKKYQFTLLSIGSYFEGIIDPENRHLVEVYGWEAFEAHSYRMMALDIDIALIPLADIPFNDYKSSIKLYEFSAMGVPSIVANKLPYSEDITPGINALLYNTPAEFYDRLETLLTNDSARKSIGDIAFKASRSLYGAKEHVNTWIDEYRKLL